MEPCQLCKKEKKQVFFFDAESAPIPCDLDTPWCYNCEVQFDLIMMDIDGQNSLS